MEFKKQTRLFIISSLLFFFLTKPAFALVCSSSKKGAVGGNSSVGAASYSYSPNSWGLRAAMLKRGHIRLLRNNPNPDVCSLPVAGCEYSTETQCCPAKTIKKTIHDYGSGRYWLIFNEPMVEEEYTADFGKTSGRVAANDAAFAISFIKTMDPTAKFIVGWLYYRWYDSSGGFHETSIASEWPNVAPTYGLNADINQEIDGWSVHYVDAATIAAAPPAWPLRLISPGKEIWVTELGTLGDPQCYYLKLTDPATAAGCINYMQNLVYGMENSPYITKYFWWSFNACNPSTNPTYPGCYGPLFVNNSLNKLGEAFAAIPNDNGVCRYSQTTPTPTSTPIPPSPTPTPIPGDVNHDGHVNMADYSIFVSKYGTNDSSCDFNRNGTVDMGDYAILVNNYGR